MQLNIYLFHLHVEHANSNFSDSYFYFRFWVKQIFDVIKHTFLVLVKKRKKQDLLREKLGVMKV